MHVLPAVQSAFLHAKPQLVPSVQTRRLRVLPLCRDTRRRSLSVIPACLIAVLASEPRFSCDTTLHVPIKSFPVRNHGPDGRLSARWLRAQRGACGALRGSSSGTAEHIQQGGLGRGEEPLGPRYLRRGWIALAMCLYREEEKKFQNLLGLVFFSAPTDS